MGIADLEGKFEANKLPILAAAGAGVVGLALYRRHKGTAAAVGSADNSASAGGQVAGASGANAYDSSSSDVYGLLQPQLESLGGQLTDLKDKLGQVPVNPGPQPKPGPAPKPTPKPAPHAPTPPPHVPIARPQQPAPYIVKPGDNLSLIASHYKSPSITPGSLYNLNRGVIGNNPNVIRPGEKLKIG